jgi:hypothetical protein
MVSRPTRGTGFLLTASSATRPLIQRPFQALLAIELRDDPDGRCGEFNQRRHLGGAQTCVQLKQG